MCGFLVPNRPTCMKPTVGPPAPEQRFHQPSIFKRENVSFMEGRRCFFQIFSADIYIYIIIYILIFCFDGSWNHRSNPGDKTHPKSLMEFISITLNQSVMENHQPSATITDVTRHPQHPPTSRGPRWHRHIGPRERHHVHASADATASVKYEEAPG